jgi:hypothetical protein
MKRIDMSGLLDAITERVTGDGKPYGNSTAPVELSIGYIGKTGMCMHDGIVITSAPAAVTDIVIKWVNQANDDDPDAAKILIEPGCGGLIIR